jgi:acetyl-CoA carboxylase carboxyl transferase subunit alpha
MPHHLAFEAPVVELEERIARLEAQAGEDAEIADEVRRLRRERVELIRRIYSHLEPWQTIEVARHPDRPRTSDYINLVFDEFVELHGDRAYGDDRAIRTGLARLDHFKVLLVGHEKGRTLEERKACNFGCAHPEGYRKALAKMRLAAKFGMPVVTLIDTPGAYPGVGAEERGQASVIAYSIQEMSRLCTPIISLVIGEGGSGGALAIGVGDRIAMLEFAYYSVISPEGCAGILWKSDAYKEQAARALRLTSADLHRLGVVDDIIEEPLGGAHRDHHQMANALKMYLVRTLRQLVARPRDEIMALRYEKFRRMGQFVESGVLQNGAPTGMAPVVADSSPSPDGRGSDSVRAPHGAAASARSAASQ